jgi:hypothetical protein
MRFRSSIRVWLFALVLAVAVPLAALIVYTTCS